MGGPLFAATAGKPPETPAKLYLCQLWLCVTNRTRLRQIANLLARPWFPFISARQPWARLPPAMDSAGCTKRQSWH